MEAIYSLNQASVHDVQSVLSGEPSYSATRMLLQRLHKKGLLQVEREANRYLYSATAAKGAAGRTALKDLIGTFFAGSATEAVSALLGDDEITEDELASLEALVTEAKAKASSRSSSS